MDNALKYCPEGGDISILLPHLFERFYRGDQSRSSGGQTKGYGIGLSIAQAVTTAHKGRIWASSSDGQSLTITVQIPADSGSLSV